MFKSPCRICKCWSVQNHHWVPDDYFAIVDLNNGHYEECIPSNNLEYLEWLYDKKVKTNV